MKFLKYIYISMSMILIGGCADHEVFNAPNDTEESDGLTIVGSLSIPDLGCALTRGNIGDHPTDANLKLTILEFEDTDDSKSSFLQNVYKAECTTTTAVANEGTVTFKVTLHGTTESRKLHLIVADDYVNPSSGSEASIFGSPTSELITNGYEAYWGMVKIEGGYVAVSTNADGTTVTTPRTDYIKQQLTNVPVIRNFASVSVTESLDNFEILGYCLVNVPTSGTMVPWDAASMQTPELLNGSTMKEYTAITYGGIIPGSSGFKNQETDKDFSNSSAINGNQVTWSRDVQYLYEHPYESTRHTYMVIYGRYNDSQGWHAGYYKIDFGHSSGFGFEYYNIIRNFNYKVTVTGVYAQGFATLNEALNGRTFNNITADTKMLSVSNGQNLLTVDATRHLFVQEGSARADNYTFTTSYIKDITGAQTQASMEIYVSGLVPGDVIASVDSVTNNQSKTYTITPKVLAETESEKTQTFKVFDGNGIGREITLVLTRPYQFSNVIVRKGTNDSNLGYTTSENIGTGAGDEFTLYFNLPAGMPEAIFPLTFQIESQNQIMENNQIGTLSVNTGPSLFDPNVVAISYLKTVTYNEYQYAYGSDGDLNIGVLNPSHTIRCRFKTITAGTGTDEIMVHNEYFKNAEITVAR